MDCAIYEQSEYYAYAATTCRSNTNDLTDTLHIIAWRIKGRTLLAFGSGLRDQAQPPEPNTAKDRSSAAPPPSTLLTFSLTLIASFTTLGSSSVWFKQSQN